MSSLYHSVSQVLVSLLGHSDGLGGLTVQAAWGPGHSFQQRSGTRLSLKIEDVGGEAASFFLCQAGKVPAPPGRTLPVFISP